MSKVCDAPATQPQQPDPCACGPLAEAQYPQQLPAPSYKYTCPCPSKPASSIACLDDLIKQQANEIAAAEKLKPLKGELEAIQARTMAASQEYTNEKYSELLKIWSEADCCVVKVIKRLTCSIPGWECIIDCYMSPALFEIHHSETLLGELSTGLPPEIKDLYDRKYWAERNRDNTQRRLQYIIDVLKCWDKPHVQIEKTLNDNAKLIADLGKWIDAGDPKAVYDVFFKLIPRHLAVAPPSEVATTNVHKRYTDFCGFDKGCPEECCGPDVGRLSLRTRLIGPLPYLIDPGQLLPAVCCLAEKHYLPAMKAAAKAAGYLVEVEEQIKRERMRVDKGLKDFEAEIKKRLPTKAQSCCQDSDIQPNAPAQIEPDLCEPDPCEPEQSYPTRPNQPGNSYGNNRSDDDQDHDTMLD